MNFRRRHLNTINPEMAFLKHQHSSAVGAYGSQDLIDVQQQRKLVPVNKENVSAEERQLWTAPLSFGFGSIDRMSARVIVFPCRYSMVKSYPCIFWSILWCLGGALRRGFLEIISSGL